MAPLDIDVELARGERLLAQARYADAVACARGVLAHELGDQRALDLIDRAEQRAGADASLSDGEWGIGEVIDGRWTVFGSARGGMGRVYFVRDRVWDNAELAVKSFLEPPCRNGDADHHVRALFRRETQVWLDLGAHPHIVSGYYTLEVQGRLRFFMEFVAGPTLFSIAQAGPLPLPRVLDFAIQLAGGIAHVHERGVVHRDLKPANCLVMDDDTVRITDFGLGKSVGRREVSRASDRVAIANLSVRGAGTPFYMAPEQWGSLSAAERPADVYAIGVMLWELLAGRRPFEPSRACCSAYRSLPAAIARLVASSEPPWDVLLPLMHAELEPLSLRQIGLAIPVEVDDLILACLAKDPGARPSAAALRAELVRVHHAVTGRVPPRPAPIAIEPSAAGDSNRALSYEVMEERARAISILDGALARDRTAPYPWANRAAIAIEDGTPPCVYSARAVSELLPAHPGLLDDDALRPVFERLARFYQPCPPVMALDTTDEIYAVGGHGVVAIFDAATGRLQATHDTSDIVLGVACLGSTGVAVADGAAITIVPLSTNDPTPVRLEGHSDLVTGLAASPDGSQLASTSNDGTLAVWEVGTGRVSWRFPLPTRARSVIWHPSGEPIVITTSGQVYQIDPAGRSTCLVRSGALCAAVGLGGTIVVGGRDGTLSHIGSHARTVLASDSAIVAVHAASDVIAAADEGGGVRAWGPSDLAAKAPLIQGRIRGLRVAPSGSEVVIGSEAGELHVWSLRATGTWPRAIQRDFPALEKRRRAQEVAVIVRRLAAGDPAALVEADLVRRRYPQHRRDLALLTSRHHIIHAGGLASGASDVYSVWTTQLPGRATGIATSPDGGVAVSMTDGIVILDRHTGAITDHVLHAANLGVSIDGNIVVVADDHGGIARMGHRGMLRWTAHWRGTGQLRAAACAAGVVVAGGWARSALRTAWQEQGAVRLWRIPDDTAIELKRVGHTVTAVAISPDASVVAAGVDDGRSLTWAVDRREVVHEVQGPDEVTAIALSSDVRYVAVGYATGQISLYLLTRSLAVVTASPLRAAPTSLSFSADGRRLFGAAREGSIVVLELPSLRCIMHSQVHAQAAYATISSDGERIASASEDGTARMWRVIAGWSPPDQIIDELDERIAAGKLSGDPLDAALDAWRVLSRVRSLPGIGSAVRLRAENLASRIASQLRALVRPETATSVAEQILSPYARVLAVDPRLAALWSPPVR